MNREQREDYLVLTTVSYQLMMNRELVTMTFSLCHFCRHARILGSPCSDDGEVECEHPVDDFLAWNPDVFYGHGNDCEGFSPMFVHEDCVDALGLALQGQHVDWDTLRLVGKPSVSTE